MTKEYIIVNDTYYTKGIDPLLVAVLEACRTQRIRIVIDYGDIETGRSWGEENDITGYIGRTTGPIKRPILVYNNRSHGGGIISDDCILSIKTSRGGRLIYTTNQPH